MLQQRLSARRGLPCRLSCTVETGANILYIGHDYFLPEEQKHQNGNTEKKGLSDGNMFQMP